MIRNEVRAPRYGELCVVKHPEAASIWRSRNEEVEPTPQFEPDPCEPSVNHEDIDMGAACWRIAETALTPRQLEALVGRFILGLTHDEIGQCLDVGKARASQIELKALQRLRVAVNDQFMRKNFPRPPRELADFEPMQWRHLSEIEELKKAAS